MANTEGMPDEFVGEIEAAQTGDSAMMSSASRRRREEEQRQRARFREQQRKKRLQKRMELPMGEGGRPSATVVRASPGNHNLVKEPMVDPMFSNNTNSDNADNADNGSRGGDAAPPNSGTSALPLVGDIIEHKQNRGGNNRIHRNPNKVSRFASRNRGNDDGNGDNNNNNNNNNNKHDKFRQKHATGFPSVHNVPLGTFVKRKPKGTTSKRRSPATAASINPPAFGGGSQQQSSSGSIGRGIGIDTDINGSNASNQSQQHGLAKEKEASQREAQAMLADMSPDEIREQQQEIEQALSPDLIAFLKNRRRKPGAGKASAATATATATKTTTTAKENGVGAIPETDSVAAAAAAAAATARNKDSKALEEREAEREEKKRIAKLVASIQTHEDLDATYRAEMKGDLFGGGEHHRFQSNQEKEQFKVACDLLRSSSPRQTLWAVRTVSIQLEDLVVATQLSSVRPWHRAKEEVETASTAEKTDDRNTAIAAIDELPSVLSVSLRCLLDKPLNSSCNYLLHTYALQSLYYLTILCAHPGHDVIHIGSSLSTMASCCTGVSLFQEDFMDDAVPAPSLDTAYPPMTVRPVDVDEETGRPKIASETTATAGAAGSAAYMTASSTASAVTDGEDFRKDPMWTLLSKMKIIPRLAFLLEHQQHMKGVIPAEALVAMCGILAMVGQRSPGAASAIVQHKSLIPLLLKRMLEQVQQRWNIPETSPPQQQQQQQQQQHRDGKGDGIVLATMRLFCILARQSRVAAEGLPLEDILPPLMATGLASSRTQYRIQQHALFLWRTVLRYGLGLEALASMVTESTRHLALPLDCHEFSLSSEFLSAFTVVLECAKVVKIDIANNNHGPAAREATTPRFPAATMDIAQSATTILASSLPMVLPKPLETRTTTTTTTIENAGLDTTTGQQHQHRISISTCRWNASRLLYLTAWFQLFDPTIRSGVATIGGDDDASIEDYISLDDQESLLRTLQIWAEPGGDARRAWHVLAKWCDPGRDVETAPTGTDEETTRAEASASGFLNAYFSMALVVLRATVPNRRRLNDMKRSLHETIVGMVLEGLGSATNSSVVADDGASASTSNTLPTGTESTSSPPPSSTMTAPARTRWINQCHFSVAKFCFHSMSVGMVGTTSDLTLLRGMVFSLLGRLERGDESIAAVLFSSDVLFQTCGDPVQDQDAVSTTNPSSSSSSPISSMFLGELCGSDSARKQLDHSFKLHRGLGITSAGDGPFGLDSLLSGADKPHSAPSSAAANNGRSDNDVDDDHQTALPLGKLWLWQCFSGSIRMRDDVVAVGTKEASDVIAAVLQLILELDETEEVMGISASSSSSSDSGGYTGRLPVGAKLYYLMNVCLHHENVLRDERILNSGEVLFNRYMENFGSNDDDIVDFCRECLDHSGHANKTRLGNNSSSSNNNNNTGSDGDDVEDGLEEKDKKLLDDFATALTTIHLDDARIPSEQIRALVAFLEDLTTAYRDYGAQYDLFTKCIRVFLLPLFPSLIRCRGLKELENMLHLLTLPNESSYDANNDDDEREMERLLSRSLSGGLPATDGSLRDGNGVLNALAMAAAAAEASPRPLEGYMRHVCIGTLARNLAISVSTGRGTELSKKRLRRLGGGSGNAGPGARNLLRDICGTAERFLEAGDGSKASLIRSVLEVSSSSRDCDGHGDWQQQQTSESELLDSWIAKQTTLDSLEE